MEINSLAVVVKHNFARALKLNGAVVRIGRTLTPDNETLLENTVAGTVVGP